MEPIRLTVTNVARIVHETNRAFCAVLGDFSQPLWSDAPDWQKESAIAGVQGVLWDPETTPEKSHELWFNHKVEEGWSWGPTKDPEKKKHPCMVSYDQLPEERRIKDELFLAIVHVLARRCS